MNRKASVATIILLLLAPALASLHCAAANPDTSTPQLSMPIEHVNYTITCINSTLWAQIDGEYPIHIQSGCVSSGELPMVYPMPPDTTNIHVTLGDREIAWSNYTQAYPEALHHTAVGDWWMIYTVLDNISDGFVLKIHYEHPLSVVNGSYLFLYDLNISPYLTSENSGSTAYFTVRMEANTTDLRVYTAPPDSAAAEWKSANFTVNREGSVDVVSITMHSTYDVPLVGDLVVEFSDAEGVPEFPLWAVAAVILASSLVSVLYVKKQAVACRVGLSKTAN